MLQPLRRTRQIDWTAKTYLSVLANQTTVHIGSVSRGGYVINRAIQYSSNIVCQRFHNWQTGDQRRHVFETLKLYSTLVFLYLSGYYKNLLQFSKHGFCQILVWGIKQLIICVRMQYTWICFTIDVKTMHVVENILESRARWWIINSMVFHYGHSLELGFTLFYSLEIFSAYYHSLGWAGVKSVKGCSNFYRSKLANCSVFK